MIVNPQIFNYRLIISSLIIVLVALGAYSYTSYESLKTHEAFLVNEKHLIETELTEMLESYEDVSEKYQFVSDDLEAAKREIQVALDSLKILKGNLSVVTRYKTQLALLQTKNKALLKALDSLSNENLKLEKESRLAYNSLQKKNKTISVLQSEKDSLNKTIVKAAQLAVTRVDSKVYKLTNGGKKRFTEKARRADAIDICITLAENLLVDKGNKAIYIQILNPKNNVISDHGSVQFGDNTLIYSQKEVVFFDNKTIDICTSISASNDDKPLDEGLYYVNVFHNDKFLSSTSFELK
jgi:hypothetical protein